MKTRLLVLSIAASAAVAGCSFSDITGNDGDGVLRDTLPLTIADSVVTFSVARSAVYVGDTVSVFFSVQNNSAQPLVLQGSSSCTFNVNAYSVVGVLVSPSAGRICTLDLRQWGTIAPGASFAYTWVWTANSAGNGPSALPAGIYDLEAFVQASGFERTGRRLKFQIFNR